MRRLLTVCAVLTAAAWAGPGLTAGSAPPAGRAPGPPPSSMLTVDSIMRGPKLVGASPSAIRWSRDASKVYFNWQKAGEERSATWVVTRDGSGLRQLSDEEANNLDVPATGQFDAAHKRALAVTGGDITITDAATGTRTFLTRTSDVESNPRWARHDTAVTFVRGGNLFLLSLDGSVEPVLLQLTDIRTADEADSGAQAATGRGGRGGGRGGRGGGAGQAQGGGGELTASQRVVRDEEMSLFDFLKKQAEARGQRGRGGRGGRGGNQGQPAPPIARATLEPRQTVSDLELSPDQRYVWIGVLERSEQSARGQDVPNYVTASGYPEIINGRSDVGDVQPRRLLATLDLKDNTLTWADASAFAGTERKAKPSDPDVPRIVDWTLPDTSDDGSHGIVAARAQDTKDRWFVTVDPATGAAAVLDTLHDDAWIREMSIGNGGFAGAGVAWLPDNRHVLFLSEKSGWMHLYSLDVTAPGPPARALTSGRWEVTDAQLSADRGTVFLTTNEVHPGERQFYTMPVAGGPMTRLTTMTGSNDATVSPDEKMIALVYSYTIKPPELYLMPFAPGAKAVQVTTTPSEEWRTFKWIDPKIITYKARDGAEVYARLFTPEMIGAKRDPKKPGVVFVHGAGYLQEAHKYWSSSYYRENMFNNLLASRGYVVLDPDYRASAGYGRDWRTAIYRHMGGQDLDDVVDGAKYLATAEHVDPKRIGVYGGSYGGFITLMAMFTTPDVFAAGAALRPVTDWAHYNHGYTSDILNVPQNDIEAYRQSSPIYFADGLKGRLLICHGMVDTNVFFQDSVRLAQRLIELRKENWAIAPFPIENHGFTEETSWADEYKRILKMFEETLRH